MAMQVSCLLAVSGRGAVVGVPCDATVGDVRVAACAALSVRAASVTVSIGEGATEEGLPDTVLLCDTAYTTDATVTLHTTPPPRIACPARHDCGSDVVLSLALSCCGRYCIVGFSACKMMVFSTETGDTIIHTVRDLGDVGLSSLCGSRCGEDVFAGFTDSYVMRITLCNGVEQAGIEMHGVEALDATFDYVVVGADSGVHLLSAEDLTVLHQLTVDACFLDGVVFTPCGGFVIIGNEVTTLWGCVSGERVRDLPFSSECLAVSFCGDWIAAGGAEMALYGMHGGERITTYSDSACDAVAFTPCGTYVLGHRARQNALCQYNVETAECVRVVRNCYCGFSITLCSGAVIFEEGMDNVVSVRSLHPSEEDVTAESDSE